MTIDIAHLASFPDYIPTIATWLQQEWEYLSPEVTLHDRIRELEGSLHRRQLPLTLIALEGENLVGVVSLTEDEMETHTELNPWLTNLYVEETHRGQGVAQKLVGRIIESASSLGYGELYLFTFEEREFFEGLGFEVVANESYRQRATTIMRRPIAAGTQPGAP